MMLKFYFLALLCAAPSLACPSPSSPRGEIVCYYDGSLKVPLLAPCKCTLLVVSEVSIGDNLQLTSNLDFDQVNKLKVKNPHLKLLISVGGSSTKPEVFSSIASSVESLSNFTDGVMSFVDRNRLDGVEIDWRWPGSPGALKSKDDLTTLMKVLRLGLDQELQNVSRRSVDEADSDLYVPTLLSTLLGNARATDVVTSSSDVETSTLAAILDHVTQRPLVETSTEPVFPEEFFDEDPPHSRNSDYLLLDDYQFDTEPLEEGKEEENEEKQREEEKRNEEENKTNEKGNKKKGKYGRGTIKFKDHFKGNKPEELHLAANRQGLMSPNPSRGSRGGWKIAKKRVIGPAERIVRPLEKRVGQGKILMLSISPKPEHIVKAYDLKELARIVDMFSVPSDNLTSSSFEGEQNDPVTYHHSRLMGVSDIHNADSLLDLIVSMGVPLDRLILGVPTTAGVFTLADAKNNLPRSKAEGPPSWIPYKKVCSYLDSGNWTLERDEDLTGTYAYLNKTWIAFDDPISLRIKSKYALLRGLAGVGIHSVDHDDWMGDCVQGPYPLLTSVYEIFTQLARTPRKAVLRSLVRDLETAESSVRASYVGSSTDLRISPFRIVRIVDRTGAITAIRSNGDTKYECSRQGYYRDPEDCSQFYRCVKFNQYIDDYTVFEYSCPVGLVFDDRWEICSWPSTAPPCDGSSEIFPVPREKNICTREGYFTDPENCRWFFACRDYYGNGTFTLYEFRCPFGLAYDEENKICNWPWLVSSCGEADLLGHSKGRGKSISSFNPYKEVLDQSKHKDCLNCEGAEITIGGNGIYHEEKGIIVPASYFEHASNSYQYGSQFNQPSATHHGFSFNQGANSVGKSVDSGVSASHDDSSENSGFSRKYSANNKVRPLNRIKDADRNSFRVTSTTTGTSYSSSSNRQGNVQNNPSRFGTHSVSGIGENSNGYSYREPNKPFEDGANTGSLPHKEEGFRKPHSLFIAKQNSPQSTSGYKYNEPNTKFQEGEYGIGNQRREFAGIKEASGERLSAGTIGGRTPQTIKGSKFEIREDGTLHRRVDLQTHENSRPFYESNSFENENFGKNTDSGFNPPPGHSHTGSAGHALPSSNRAPGRQSNLSNYTRQRPSNYESHTGTLNSSQRPSTTSGETSSGYNYDAPSIGFNPFSAHESSEHGSGNSRGDSFPNKHSSPNSSGGRKVISQNQNEGFHFGTRRTSNNAPTPTNNYPNRHGYNYQEPEVEFNPLVSKTVHEGSKVSTNANDYGKKELGQFSTVPKQPRIPSRSNYNAGVKTSGQRSKVQSYQYKPSSNRASNSQESRRQGNDEFDRLNQSYNSNLNENTESDSRSPNSRYQESGEDFADNNSHHSNRFGSSQSYRSRNDNESNNSGRLSSTSNETYSPRRRQRIQQVSNIENRRTSTPTKSSSHHQVDFSQAGGRLSQNTDQNKSGYSKSISAQTGTRQGYNYQEPSKSFDEFGSQSKPSTDSDEIPTYHNNFGSQNNRESTEKDDIPYSNNFDSNDRTRQGYRYEVPSKSFNFFSSPAHSKEDDKSEDRSSPIVSRVHSEEGYKYDRPSSPFNPFVSQTNTKSDEQRKPTSLTAPIVSQVKSKKGYNYDRPSSPFNPFISQTNSKSSEESKSTSFASANRKNYKNTAFASPIRSSTFSTNKEVGNTQGYSASQSKTIPGNKHISSSRHSISGPNYGGSDSTESQSGYAYNKPSSFNSPSYKAKVEETGKLQKSVSPDAKSGEGYHYNEPSVGFNPFSSKPKAESNRYSSSSQNRKSDTKSSIYNPFAPQIKNEERVSSSSFPSRAKPSSNYNEQSSSFTSFPSQSKEERTNNFKNKKPVSHFASQVKSNDGYKYDAPSVSFDPFASREKESSRHTKPSVHNSQQLQREKGGTKHSPIYNPFAPQIKQTGGDDDSEEYSSFAPRRQPTSKYSSSSLEGSRFNSNKGYKYDKPSIPFNPFTSKTGLKGSEEVEISSPFKPQSQTKQTYSYDEPAQPFNPFTAQSKTPGSSKSEEQTTFSHASNIRNKGHNVHSGQSGHLTSQTIGKIKPKTSNPFLPKQQQHEGYSYDKPSVSFDPLTSSGKSEDVFTSKNPIHSFNSQTKSKFPSAQSKPASPFSQSSSSKSNKGYSYNAPSSPFNPFKSIGNSGSQFGGNSFEDQGNSHKVGDKSEERNYNYKSSLASEPKINTKGKGHFDISNTGRSGHSPSTNDRSYESKTNLAAKNGQSGERSNADSQNSGYYGHFGLSSQDRPNASGKQGGSINIKEKTSNRHSSSGYENRHPEISTSSGNHFQSHQNSGQNKHFSNSAGKERGNVYDDGSYIASPNSDYKNSDSLGHFGSAGGAHHGSQNGGNKQFISGKANNARKPFISSSNGQYQSSESEVDGGKQTGGAFAHFGISGHSTNKKQSGSSFESSQVHKDSFENTQFRPRYEHSDPKTGYKFGNTNEKTSSSGHFGAQSNQRGSLEDTSKEFEHFRPGPSQNFLKAKVGGQYQAQQNGKSIDHFGSQRYEGSGNTGKNGFNQEGLSHFSIQTSGQNSPFDDLTKNSGPKYSLNGPVKTTGAFQHGSDARSSEERNKYEENSKRRYNEHNSSTPDHFSSPGKTQTPERNNGGKYYNQGSSTSQFKSHDKSSSIGGGTKPSSFGHFGLIKNNKNTEDSSNEKVSGYRNSALIQNQNRHSTVSNTKISNDRPIIGSSSHGHFGSPSVGQTSEYANRRQETNGNQPKTHAKSFQSPRFDDSLESTEGIDSSQYSNHNVRNKNYGSSDHFGFSGKKNAAIPIGGTFGKTGKLNTDVREQGPGAGHFGFSGVKNDRGSQSKFESSRNLHSTGKHAESDGTNSDVHNHFGLNRQGSQLNNNGNFENQPIEKSHSNILSNSKPSASFGGFNNRNSHVSTPSRHNEDKKTTSFQKHGKPEISTGYPSSNSGSKTHQRTQDKFSANSQKLKNQNSRLPGGRQSGHTSIGRPKQFSNSYSGLPFFSRKPASDSVSLLTKLGSRPKFQRFGPGGVRDMDDGLTSEVCERAGLFRHPDSCDKFYECYWDKWVEKFTLHVFDCPVTIVYDSGITACNWPFNGPTCTEDKYS